MTVKEFFSTQKRYLYLSAFACLFFVIISVFTGYYDAIKKGNDYHLIERVSLLTLSYSPWLLYSWAISFLLHKHQFKLPIKIYFRVSAVWLFLYLIYDLYMFAKTREIDNFESLFAYYPAFYVLFSLFLLIISLSATQAYWQKIQRQKIEKEYQTVKLKALQGQLEPHFLFNALNSVTALIRIDEKQKAISSLTQLSELLRSAVDASNCKLIPLSDEIRFIKSYLSLQSLRYGNKLTYAIEFDPSTHLLGPPFTLQPLVENAIVHTLDQGASHVEIIIKVSHGKDSTTLSVTNSVAPKANATSHTGCGSAIKNLKQRLAIAFKQGVSFTCEQSESHYACHITIKRDAHD